MNFDSTQKFTFLMFSESKNASAFSGVQLFQSWSLWRYFLRKWGYSKSSINSKL